MATTRPTITKMATTCTRRHNRPSTTSSDRTSYRTWAAYLLRSTLSPPPTPPPPSPTHLFLLFLIITFFIRMHTMLLLLASAVVVVTRRDILVRHIKGQRAVVFAQPRKCCHQQPLPVHGGASPPNWSLRRSPSNSKHGTISSWRTWTELDKFPCEHTIELELATTCGFTYLTFCCATILAQRQYVRRWDSTDSTCC